VLRQALTRLRRSSSERARASALLLTAAFALLLTAAASQRDEVPPKPTRWVTDDAGMLAQAAATALDTRLQNYERQTGHQVVVWIGTTTTLPLEELATRTFQAWELGRKGHDDGVLILLLATDRKIAIEVGYGLEDRVPDALASRIINDVMVPELRGGNPEAAVNNGVNAVLSAIEGKAVASKPQSSAKRDNDRARRAPIGTGQAIVIALLALGFFILLLTNPSLAITLLAVLGSGGRGGGGFRSGGFGGGGGFSGGGGRSGGGGARGSW
jgi:uncharacterized protein